MACASKPPRFVRPSEYADWRYKFEKYIAENNPELLVFLTERYGHSLEKDYEKEIRAYEAIKMSLSRDVRDLFTKHKTSCDLWKALAERFGDKHQLKSNSPDEGIKEKKDMLVKKDEEIKALQEKILNMENDREEMRLKVVSLEKKMAEYEDQQPAMTKLKEDHELALNTIQDLREKLAEVSQLSKTQVKDVKKICKDKSSGPLLRMVRDKKISQFTNYSLQKNKKYSEKSQSTKTSKHQKVDCGDNSGYSPHVKSSVLCQKPKGAFKPTQLPESGQRKSFTYTRAQMFALAPPRSHHMVQKRRKDFIPFSPRMKTNHLLIPRKQFRIETTRFNFRWNSMSLDYIDETYRRFSKLKTQIGTVLKWVPKIVA